MKKRNKKHEKRVKKLIVCCALCAIILSVSTYAWFIGMKTVNVSSFDISIATTESLLLSLNGKDWSYEVSINESNFNDSEGGTVYAGNTNSWGGKGLVPVSSIGKINPASSRLTMYEKGSLTATEGGYRLMASEVQNSGPTEAEGYVAFDLFVKNFSGEEYYPNYDSLNEEAIYLTPESAVTVSDDGGEKGTGIENSVRVAFAQIGRVEATNDTTEDDDVVPTITGIDCNGTGGSTKICDQKDATIWEPNDTKHVQNAITWYDKSCKGRTGADTSDASYTGDCDPVINGEAKLTYAIAKEITDSDLVDVYDGADYNGYTQTVTSGELKEMNYFTDSEKVLKGVDRPTFMTLAPNSVTKVRVYIYLEGQDVDNYDFASLGKKISVAFGFTKERFYGEDINYEGPELPDDVVRNEQVAYEGTNVTEITPSEVTYENGNFTVPKTVSSFTFKDDGASKIATRNTDLTWTIEDVTP